MAHRAREGETVHLHVDQDGSKGLRLEDVIPEPPVDAEGRPPFGCVRPMNPNNIHRPRVALADYVDASVAPPVAVWRAHRAHDFGMLLNDKLGDCGEAMAIHGIEIVHLSAGTPVPPFADIDAEVLYEHVGGYVPGDPSTDNGTDNEVLVQQWTKPGIRCAADKSRHTIVGTAWIDPGDAVNEKRAIYEFGVLYRAIGLPISAQTQTRWHVTDPGRRGDAALGSWGGHDIPEYSYDAVQRLCISWRLHLLLAEDFDAAYALGGFAVITQEMLDRKGLGPSGVDWEKLTADLARL